MPDSIIHAPGNSLENITVDTVTDLTVAARFCDDIAAYLRTQCKNTDINIPITFNAFSAKIREFLGCSRFNVHRQLRLLKELAQAGRALRSAILNYPYQNSDEIHTAIIATQKLGIINDVVSAKAPEFILVYPLIKNMSFVQNKEEPIKISIPRNLQAIEYFLAWQKEYPNNNAETLLAQLKEILLLGENFDIVKTTLPAEMLEKETQITTLKNSILTASGSILISAINFLNRKNADITALTNALEFIKNTILKNPDFESSESCMNFLELYKEHQELSDENRSGNRNSGSNNNEILPPSPRPEPKTHPKTIPECAKACVTAGADLEPHFPGINPLLINISEQLKVLNSASVIPAFTTVSEAITQLQLFIIATPVTDQNAPHLQKIIDFLNSIKPITQDLGNISTDGKEISTTGSFFTAAPFVTHDIPFSNRKVPRVINLDEYLGLPCLSTKVPEIAQALQTNIDLVNRYLLWKMHRHQNQTSTKTDIIDVLSEKINTIIKGSESEHILLACCSYILCDAANHLDDEKRGEAKKPD